MLLATLREEVLEANLELVRRGLVLSTFGNASGIARTDGLIVIKPSGVPYEAMKARDLVVTDLHGQVVEGTLRPSSDACCTVSSFSLDWWHRTYSFRIRNSVGAGMYAHPLFRNDTRRLFSWTNSGDRSHGRGASCGRI